MSGSAEGMVPWPDTFPVDPAQVSRRRTIFRLRGAVGHPVAGRGSRVLWSRRGKTLSSRDGFSVCRSAASPSSGRISRVGFASSRVWICHPRASNGARGVARYSLATNCV